MCSSLNIFERLSLGSLVKTVTMDLDAEDISNNSQTNQIQMKLTMQYLVTVYLKKNYNTCYMKIEQIIENFVMFCVLRTLHLRIIETRDLFQNFL